MASLGENGPFLQSLLETQQQQLQHLHQQNQHLLTHFNNFQSNLANAASTAAVAAAQHIVIPTSPNISSTCSIKAADPERFTGDRTETEGFIHAIKLAIAIQPGSFPDERTKILSGDSPLFPIFSMSFSLFLSLAFLPLLLPLPTSLLHSSSCLLCLPPSFLSLGFPSLVHP